MQGSSTRKTLVYARSENSRESVRSLKSALICADFYQSIFYTYCMYSKKKIGKTYENINLSFFENNFLRSYSRKKINLYFHKFKKLFSKKDKFIFS